MRNSSNETINSLVKNGFDYELQCWIENYIIQPCGHKNECNCFGRRYEYKDIRNVLDDV